MVSLCHVQELGQQLVPLVAPAVLAAGGKWGVIGHSLGCWAAYEVALALRAAGELMLMGAAARAHIFMPFGQAARCAGWTESHVCTHCVLTTHSMSMVPKHS